MISLSPKFTLDKCCEEKCCSLSPALHGVGKSLKMCSIGTGSIEFNFCLCA